jgi:hypothetical protein
VAPELPLDEMDSPLLRCDPAPSPAFPFRCDDTGDFPVANRTLPGVGAFSSFMSSAARALLNAESFAAGSSVENTSARDGGGCARCLVVLTALVVREMRVATSDGDRTARDGATASAAVLLTRPFASAAFANPGLRFARARSRAPSRRVRSRESLSAADCGLSGGTAAAAAAA